MVNDLVLARRLRQPMIDDLVRDEGLQLEAYQDTMGNWTIGVGHLLGKHARMTVITLAEAYALLDWDMNVALQAVDRLFFPDIDVRSSHPNYNDTRLRALVNMTFNRGEQRMRESEHITPAVRAALAAESTVDVNAIKAAWKAVSDAIRQSPWAGQVGVRAERLAVMLEKGVTA